MLDRPLRKHCDRLLSPLADSLAGSSLSAEAITLSGLGLASAAVLFLSLQWWSAALIAILLNRICDGLDGMVARRRSPTVFGGYLDSICDQLFYAAIPVGFGLVNQEFLLPSLILLFSFFASSGSFLAWAAVTSGHSSDGRRSADKAFEYSPGLMEGTETILFFVLFCLLPDRYPALAGLFAALCGVTALQRVLRAKRLFS